MPGCHGGCLADGYACLAQDGGVEALTLHADWHLVDACHILALHHTFQVDIAERSHLHAQCVVEVALGAQHKDVGLDAHALQFPYGMLGGLRLQFIGCLQVGNVCQVHTNGIAPQLPSKLTDSFHERRTLYVADGAAHLCNDEIQFLFRYIFSQHPSLYLVRDVWHHLDGLAQVVATTLAVDDSLVDAPRRYAVVTCGMYACEALVVAEIQVRLHAVGRDVALAMLIGVQRSRVNVDVRVELLDSDLVATCLQQLADARGYDALSERGNHAACHEDVLCIHNYFLCLMMMQQLLHHDAAIALS